jgi:hypothetical protein
MRLSATVARLCLLVTFCCCAQDASQLVGRWRSAETSQGGIGAMYDFDANGTVRFSPGAIVPMRYQLQANHLDFVPAEGAGYELAWTDENHLRLTQAGAVETCTRLGQRPDPNDRLTGEWIGSRDMDGKKVVVHWIFGGNGSGLLMIRFLTQVGAYSVQNGRLLATFGGRTGLDGPVSFAENSMAINRSNGRVTRLVRY